VNFSGTAIRSLSGVQAIGTWNFNADLGNGEVANGQGSWTSTKVLLFDGFYSGSFRGTIVTNNNGTITTAFVPGGTLRDTSIQLTISNGVVAMSLPGIGAVGTGTIDGNGKIDVQVSFQSQGTTVTVHFVGTAVQTPLGDVITGKWFYSVDFGNGITQTGSGIWQVTSQRWF
jgi:hypothetical protein